MNTLDGKVALVTGGSRGIGAAIAVVLAEHGADVAVTYRHDASAVVEAVKGTGRRVLALRADAADADAMVQAVDDVVGHFGRIDILVNNAGVVGDLDDMWAVNVKGAWVAAEAAVRHLPRGGRIVNIGSNLAERVPMAGITAYAMTKSALNSMTHGLARDLAQRGINVTQVNPGSTDTDMNPADGPNAPGQLGLIPLGRFGAPREIALTVAHLAGPGGDYITGTSVLVDGGVNA
ncbi:SDR family NAD(P)-dependent oxidoreductase [Actinokineospora sp. UTMC 2448]|uniref:SDR family NAD(P)-dependent oxidoreductase n=1 Tax=Actinokineospora sp. UTMC 2448 TaxID=2268449 RepID=UPI0021646D23|nr:SDR family oxidoreductase [Actinokineospora sp. UTMC 2448]UVS82415.1 Cyclic-di-GMP-binding biofilm dispersal mediator protein [Actinokineospora sp. UTMC 2448]